MFASVLQAASLEGLCEKELARRRAPRKRLSGAFWCSSIGGITAAGASSCTWRWEHSYARRSHNHARGNAAASCVGVEVSVQVGR